MWGWGRWTVRDRFGERWTFLLSARATADERAEAIPEQAARWAVERTLVRLPDWDRSVLIELAGVATFDAHHYSSDQLKTLIKRRVGPLGPLLVLGDSAGSRVAPRSGVTVAPTPERRLIAAIMGRRQTIGFEGRQYRVAATPVSNRGGGNDFELVAADEARAVLSRLRSSPHVTTAQREALDEGASRVVDRSQYQIPGGLVLLRRVVRPSYTAPSEPTTTPSALRAAAKKDISLKFVEVGTGRPLAGAAVKLAGPDGNERRLTTADDGSVKLTDLDPGQCIATSVITNATAEASFVPGASGTMPSPVDDADDGDDDTDTSPIQPSWLVEVDEYQATYTLTLRVRSSPPWPVFRRRNARRTPHQSSCEPRSRWQLRRSRYHSSRPMAIRSPPRPINGR